MFRSLILLLAIGTLQPALAYPPELPEARSEVYRTIGDTELKLWIFGETVPDQGKPAILFFFGGGWNSGSPMQFVPQAKHFAERGMIAMVVDYRVKSRHEVKAVECVKDGKAALAWVRTHADRLGIDPKRIATAGGSAGGHVAACIGTLPGLGSEERPNAMILFNPVTTLGDIGDWKARGFGVKSRLGVDTMSDLSPAHHVGAHTPPTLILHGTEDTTVPIESAEAFESQMEKHQRPCKLVRYDGAGHGFFNRGQPYEQTLEEADAFLVELGWLKEP